jgi:hypothetical protein
VPAPVGKAGVWSTLPRLLESDEQIEELVRATQAIEGVNGVKNLLHTRSTMTDGA